MTNCLYRIKDWDALYETAETRKLENLRWLPVPNKHDGLGFRRLANQRNRSELFSAWVLMLQVASRGRRGERGVLHRDGAPLSADDLSLMTGFPSAIFADALTFFSDPKQGWLLVDCNGDISSNPASATEQSAGSPGVPASSPGRPAESPACPASPPAEGKGREWKEGKEEKAETGRGAGEAAEPSPAGSQPLSLGMELPPVPPKPPKRAAAPKQTDAEWLASLKANPAYAAIDVDREHAKAAVWCQTNGKVLTRPRFVNWLNRCDRPMSGPEGKPRTWQPPSGGENY